MTYSLVKNSHLELLKEVLKKNTVSPMETASYSETPKCLDLLLDYSESIGGILRKKVIPSNQDIIGEMVPIAVKDMSQRLGEEFFLNQPSAVIEFGQPRSAEKTLMFNFHLDTVSDYFEPIVKDDIVFGRGAIDAKGQGIGALIGIENALSEIPRFRHPRILLQVVSGEEGGAMGVYGTRTLLQQGFFGRLNVVLEPTKETYMASCSAAMTAQIEVQGASATDDRPEEGDNATLILSYIASEFSHSLPKELRKMNCAMCIGGVETGTMHNRVYGSGKLHLNFIYRSQSDSSKIEDLVRKVLDRTIGNFEDKYFNFAWFSKSAQNVRTITKLTWKKKNLPVLNQRDEEIEKRVFEASGLEKFENLFGSSKTFTCDAIWADSLPNSFSAVFGSGDLGSNHAHAPGEFITLKELSGVARGVSRIIQSFSESLVQ